MGEASKECNKGSRATKRDEGIIRTTPGEGVRPKRPNLMDVFGEIPQSRCRIGGIRKMA
jgi:hypothetical protein